MYHIYKYKMTLDLSHLNSEGQGKKHYICVGNLRNVSQLDTAVSQFTRVWTGYSDKLFHGFPQSLQTNAGLLS